MSLTALSNTLRALNFRKRFGLAFLVGLVTALSMPPLNLWPLLFIGLSTFYVALAGVTGKRAFAMGWAYGFGYFLLALFWIGNALLVPGNDFIWAWPFAVLGLPVGLAIFTGLATYIAARVADLNTWRGFATLGLALMVSEFLRGHILTGFPWDLFAYGWAGLLPMVQSVSLFGVYGLTFLTIFWCTLPGFLLVSQASRRAAIMAAVLVVVSLGGLYGWGALRLSANPGQFHDDVIVRVVQPNIPQEEKWDNSRMVPNLQKLVWNSAADTIPGKTYAVIWPETAITDYIANDPNASDFIRSEVFPAGRQGYLITGVLRHEQTPEGKPEYFNSLVAYDSALRPQTIYNKSHLVPFGEYIPFQKFIPLTPIVKFSGFTPGEGVKTQLIQNFPGFSPLVCYEVLFPGRVAEKTIRPEWIINVTNDGWYGNSPGPYQHLAKSVYRAVEEGLPLMRSANTGISAIIDSYGRVQNQIAYNKEGYIDAPLPLPASPQTAYGLYRDLFTYILFFVLFGIIWFTRRG